MRLKDLVIVVTCKILKLDILIVVFEKSQHRSIQNGEVSEAREAFVMVRKWPSPIDDKVVTSWSMPPDDNHFTLPIYSILNLGSSHQFSQVWPIMIVLQFVGITGSPLLRIGTSKSTKPKYGDWTVDTMVTLAFMCKVAKWVARLSMYM